MLPLYSSHFNILKYVFILSLQFAFQPWRISANGTCFQ